MHLIKFENAMAKDKKEKAEEAKPAPVQAQSDAMPRWVAEARTKEYLDQGARFLERLNPEQWLERGRKAIEDRDRKPPP